MDQVDSIGMNLYNTFCIWNEMKRDITDFSFINHFDYYPCLIDLIHFN